MIQDFEKVLHLKIQQNSQTNSGSISKTHDGQKILTEPAVLVRNIAKQHCTLYLDWTAVEAWKIRTHMQYFDWLRTAVRKRPISRKPVVVVTLLAGTPLPLDV